MPNLLFPLLLATAILGFPDEPARALSVTATSVAFVGDPAPGVPGDSFDSVVFGSVNDSGQVAVTGLLASGTRGVWRWDVASPAAPTPVVVPGPAPVGPAGAEFGFAFAREITGSGVIGFEGNLAEGPGGVTATDSRILGTFQPGTGLELVARSGDPAPGLPGQTLLLGVAVDAIPDWNDAGQVVQSIPTLDLGPPLQFGGGLFRHDPGAGLSPIRLQGDPVPGDPTSSFGGGVIQAINESGQIGFASSVVASPGALPQAALFGPDGAGGSYEIGRVGGQAPDTPAGTTLDFFPGGGFFALNEPGQMAFAARLEVGPGGTTTADNSGLWIADAPGAIRLIFREGDPVPGSPGLSFGTLDDTPLLNDSAEMVLVTNLALGASVTSLDDRILLAPDAAGDLFLLAREGDPNPLDPGGTWSGFFFPLALSETGVALFRTRNAAGETVFYRHHPVLGLARVVGEGDSVDLGPDGVRTIDDFIDFRASPNGAWLSASARFTDGSNGLVLFSVPEPGSALLVGFGLMLLRRRPARGIHVGGAEPERRHQR